MVERINKLIKEVQSSFGLVSGSQRRPTFGASLWLTGFDRGCVKTSDVNVFGGALPLGNLTIVRSRAI